MLENCAAGKLLPRRLRAVSEPADWHEANGIVFDWASRRRRDPSVRSTLRVIDSPLPGVEDIPFAISLDANGHDGASALRRRGTRLRRRDVRVADPRHVIVSIDSARDRSGDRVVRSDPSWVGSSKT